VDEVLPGLAEQVGAAEAARLEMVLGDLATRAKAVLGGNLVGVYLVGSFALGAGDPFADVDFLTIVHQPLGASEERGIREIHTALPDRAEHWAHVLEGSYAPKADLEERADPKRKWLYVDNGNRNMEWSSHDNTEVSRWVLKNRAITIAGVPAADVVPDVPSQVLRDEATSFAVARMADIAADPAYLRNAWGQPHEVVTRCRMLYTASTATVVGKVAAARWCLESLPTRWHMLVERAIKDRPDPWDRVQREGDPRLADETWDFVQFITPLISAAAARGAPTVQTRVRAHL
jgi:predicted nucleotidyltransferase